MKVNISILLKCILITYIILIKTIKQYYAPQIFKVRIARKLGKVIIFLLIDEMFTDLERKTSIVLGFNLLTSIKLSCLVKYEYQSSNHQHINNVYQENQLT